MQQSDPNNAPSRFTRGAIDLSALAQSRPQAPPSAGAPAGQAPPAGQSPPAGGVTSIDVTDATVQGEVLERSLNVPVVIVFWTDQAPASVQMVEVLERLATEGRGAWTLAKADVQNNQQLAMALQLQSVPAIAAVVGGRPVDVQQGVLPEQALRKWVGEVVKAGGGEPPAEPVDPKLAAADQALAGGDFAAAEAAYRKYLAENPGSSDAESGLAHVRLARRAGELDLGAAVAKANADAADVSAALDAADAEMLTGQAEAAYDRLIAVIGRTAGDDRERVRKHLVELFSLADPDDLMVAAARRRLMSVLF